MNVGIQDFESANVYSKLNGELLSKIAQKEDLKNFRLDLARQDVVGFMRNYEESDHRISPWPVFINEDIVQSFKNFIQRFPRIVYKAIQVYFSTDSEKFSEYLNEPGIILDFTNNYTPDVKDLCVRHDLIFSGNQFKLIEANCGSAIGGWQHDWLSHLYNEALEMVGLLSNEQLRYRYIINAMLIATINSITKLKGGSSRGNLLFFAKDKTMSKPLQDLYEKIRPEEFCNGTIHIFNDFSELKFDAHENVIYDNKVMDAVMLTLEADVVVPKTPYLRLVSSHLKNRIVFPDSPIQTIVGNKIIMALLYEDEVLDSLTAEEQEFIYKHIPWTCKLNSGTVHWRGQEHSLQELLFSHKDSFVIKKSKSYQGRDVFVGKFTSKEDWYSAVMQFQNDNDWLVQEYCKPDEVFLCNPAVGIASHELVWGVFDFGNNYHGSFVRAVPTDNLDAVINSANGATEFTVFEQFKPKKKIII